MFKLTYIILAVFGIAAVSGNHRSRPVQGYENNENGLNYRNVYPTVYPTERPEEECRALIRREKCSIIVIDALSKFRRSKDLHFSFQHYCSKIPDFVPCLEANKADYMILMECDRNLREGVNQIMTLGDISRYQLWDMGVDFLDTVNDIICSRTEELLGLIECVKKNGRNIGPKLESCMSEYGPTLTGLVFNIGSEEYLEESTLCGSTIGFYGCVRDFMAEQCEDSTALLDTIYDDVIVGVIGNGLGCEPPSNPLLSFVRSVRDKLRR